MTLDMHQNQNFQNHIKTKTISKPKFKTSFGFGACLLPVILHYTLIYILETSKSTFWVKGGFFEESALFHKI
jgi:hypothetical protein